MVDRIDETSKRGLISLWEDEMTENKQKERLIFSGDGKGTVRRKAGVYVLHMQGTDVQMAEQHAQLLGPQAKNGLLPFMANYLTGHIKRQKHGIQRLVANSVVEGLCRHVARHMPKGQMQAFYRLGKGIGLSRAQVDVALGSADALLILMAGAGRTAKWAMQAGLAHAVPLSCSGVVISPEASANGHLLHGRNLDYDGLGFWDNSHTVAFLKPERGQPYGFITTAGIHTAALTGFNASGIFAAVNTAPTRACSWRGEPLFAVMERVVRNARDLDEAIAILSGAKIASGYNIHISHGPSGRSAVVEIAYSGMAVRYPEHGILLATNHYTTDKMVKTMPEIPLVDVRNSRMRLNRLRQIFQGQKAVDAKAIVRALGDRLEFGNGVLHPLGDVVGNYMNLSSIVADVTAGRFWMASGKAPVALSDYVGFDMNREWAAFGRMPEYEVEDIAAPGEIKGLRCTRMFQEAHKALIHHADADMCLEFILEALKECPNEPHLLLTGALVALSIGQIRLAEKLADTYLVQRPETDARRFRAHLILGWVAQLNGNAAEASQQMQQAVALANDEETRFEARWWAKQRPLVAKDLHRFHVDLFSGRRLIF